MAYPVYVNSNIKALDVGKYLFKTDHESYIVIPSKHALHAVPFLKLYKHDFYLNSNANRYTI
jgi:hypothetical protein